MSFADPQEAPSVPPVHLLGKSASETIWDYYLDADRPDELHRLWEHVKQLEERVDEIGSWELSELLEAIPEDIRPALEGLRAKDMVSAVAGLAEEREELRKLLRQIHGSAGAFIAEIEMLGILHDDK